MLCTLCIVLYALCLLHCVLCIFTQYILYVHCVSHSLCVTHLCYIVPLCALFSAAWTLGFVNNVSWYNILSTTCFDMLYTLYVHCIQHVCMYVCMYTYTICALIWRASSCATCAPSRRRGKYASVSSGSRSSCTTLPPFFVCWPDKDDKVPAPPAPGRAHQVAKLPWLRVQPPCREGSPR